MLECFLVDIQHTNKDRRPDAGLSLATLSKDALSINTTANSDGNKQSLVRSSSDSATPAASVSTGAGAPYKIFGCIMPHDLTEQLCDSTYLHPMVFGHVLKHVTKRYGSLGVRDVIMQAIESLSLKLFPSISFYDKSRHPCVNWPSRQLVRVVPLTSNVAGGGDTQAVLRAKQQVLTAKVINCCEEKGLIFASKLQRCCSSYKNPEGHDILPWVWPVQLRLSSYSRRKLPQDGFVRAIVYVTCLIFYQFKIYVKTEAFFELDIAPLTVRDLQELNILDRVRIDSFNYRHPLTGERATVYRVHPRLLTSVPPQLKMLSSTTSTSHLDMNETAMCRLQQPQQHQEEQQASMRLHAPDVGEEVIDESKIENIQLRQAASTSTWTPACNELVLQIHRLTNKTYEAYIQTCRERGMKIRSKEAVRRQLRRLRSATGERNTACSQ